MRLRSVHLENFRGVTDSLIEFSDGVTVVEGPNEVGKSSVAEAIRLLRDLKSSSGAKDIRSVQPVGRDVGPEVTLRLTTGGYDLEYRKRWLKRHLTELRVLAPRPEELSGDEAHDRFRAILADTLDLDLLVALEVQQGQSLTQPDLARIPSLRRTLDESGEQGGDHDALMEAIEAEYSRFFTHTGRPTGELRRAREELESAQEALDDLDARSRELDGFVERHARLESAVTDLVERLGRARADLGEREQDSRDLQDRAEAVRSLTRGLEEAQTRLDRAEEAVARRTALVADLSGRAQAAAAADTTVQDVTARQAAAEEAFSAAEERAATAREAETRAREEAARTAGAVTRRREAQELADLARRVEEARGARRRLRAATSALEGVTVDADRVAELVRLESDLLVAERTRDAASALVTVTALGDTPVQVGDQTLTDTTPLSTRVHDSLSVEVPGVVLVDVRAGDTPGELDEAYAQASRALAEALAAAGVGSIEEARARARDTEVAHTDHDRAGADLKRALAGEEFEALEQRLSDLRTRLDSASDPADGATPTPPSSMADLQAAADAARAGEDEAREATGLAQTALDAARGAREKATNAALVAGSEAESARKELARLTADLDAERARATDDALAAEALAAATTRNTCREQVAAAEEVLAEAEPDLVALHLDNARKLVTSTEANLQTARSDLQGCQALIEDRLAQGIGSRREEAAARAEAAGDVAERLGRDAAAVDLLRATMVRHRDEAQKRYVAPFTRRIEELGRLVFGRTFRVTITPDLTIESRTLEGRTVPFASLSAGAREQLSLIGRLACAQLVSADEGAPVILDDTLGFSDPDRLRALGAVLGKVGDTTQVIVLTCQPGRFADVGGATEVRLLPSTPVGDPEE